jgi:phosphate transport system substrate-binding protein
MRRMGCGRWTGLWVAGAVVAGCEPARTPSTEATGLRLGGSEALVKRLVVPLVASWERSHGEGSARVVGQGSPTGGIRELLAGDLDAAFSSRDATPSEDEQARVDGFRFDDPASRHVVGVDVVAVAVHPQNPIDSLTFDQVIGIFCSGSIDRWDTLGGSGPIRVVVPEPGSGPRALFEDFFCGPKGIHPKHELASSVHIASVLTDDRSAISVVSLSERAGKSMSLRVQPTAAPVRPSQANIVRGAYPLYGDLFLYTRGAPEGELGAFVDWLSGPAGQEVIDEQRFVPLSLRPDLSIEARPLRETVHFAVDAAVPDQRSAARLELLVRELEEKQYQHVVLEGFTDDRESDPYTLSERRASAVRTLLLDKLPQLYVELIPRGPSSPIAPNDTPLGRQVNRRVQVYIAEEERGTAEVVEGEATP